MQTIYKIVVGSSIRYIRAASAASAKVRAFKVWGLKQAQALAIGQQMPDIGAYGYSAASGRMDKAMNTRTIRAMQKTGGPDNTGRSFYKVTEKEKTKVNNKALALLKAYGL